jgi:glycosyltransferase involved in cell wall biosynthesis
VLSALIPTRDRPDLLRDCLVSLAAQDTDAGSMEILIVDDGSTSDLAAVVAAVRPSCPFAIRLIAQPPSGLTAGRNRAAAEANGSVLAYLDDDTLVSPGWAAAIIRAFDETGCEGLAGRVELQFEASPPRWVDTARLRLYLSEFDLGNQRRIELPGPLLPVGANCAVSRDAFDRLGGFRPGFDRVGRSLLSNGDLEFFARLRASGLRIVYEPAAHVLHRVPGERLTKAWFRRRSYAQGMSDVLLDPPSPAQPHVMAVAREIGRAARAIPILARNLLQGRGPTNARLWLTYCHGRLDSLRGRFGKPTVGAAR